MSPFRVRCQSCKDVMIPSITIVVPCYNEEEVIEESIITLSELLGEMEACKEITSKDSRICLIDDGSNDRTWEIIEELALKNKKIQGIKLTCNKGHQAALMAGLRATANHCDATISIDVDLQDDPLKIKEMVRLYQAGFEIVYGVRSDRSVDSPSKRWLAGAFYKTMLIFDIDIVPGHADFRLISRTAFRELSRYDEKSLFLRGLVPLLGYKSANVYYPRKKRDKGISKYPLKKSISLALDGILSLSFKPLRYISYIALLFSVISMVIMTSAIYQYFVGGVVPGWTSLVAVTSILGALQLISISVIGEYLGRIYRELKNRPLFHVEEKVGFNDDQGD